MAIQLPNPGLGDGQTGDNEYVMWTKVKDNFADQSNAASRLVGTGSEQLVAAKDLFKVAQSNTFTTDAKKGDLNDLGVGKYTIHNTTSVNAPKYKTGTSQGVLWCSDAVEAGGALKSLVQVAGYIENAANNQFYVRTYARYPYTGWSNWALIYTSGNTTKDTATGFLKESSPVLHVYNDKITKIHEAEELDISVDKKGVGHYEIHGTTGLRENDGWNMSPPRDLHGNVLCMIDVTEKDGVVILKTYKKKFDFETVSIVHDYDNPMDIPDGACVEFRFNDLPEEQLDEPIE